MWDILGSRKTSNENWNAYIIFIKKFISCTFERKAPYNRDKNRVTEEKYYVE